jgi:hypothetical protein
MLFFLKPLAALGGAAGASAVVPGGPVTPLRTKPFFGVGVWMISGGSSG